MPNSWDGISDFIISNIDMSNFEDVSPDKIDDEIRRRIRDFHQKEKARLSGTKLEGKEKIINAFANRDIFTQSDVSFATKRDEIIQTVDTSYLNKTKELIEDTESEDEIEAIEINDKSTYAKDLITLRKQKINTIRRVAGAEEARAEKVNIWRERGLALTGEDLQRIGVRSPARLISFYGLNEQEAAEVFARKEQ